MLHRLLLIVLAVVCAARRAQINALLGISKWFGIIALAAGVAYLVLKGTAAIEKFLSYWSYVLYAVYILFLVITFVKFGGNIGSNMVMAENSGSWVFGGATYAFYNLACIPIALFATRDAENTKEAVSSGCLPAQSAFFPPSCCFWQ
jgi:amino acid permease